MSFEAGLDAYLKAHAGLAALVGARIYPDLMPEGTSADCVTWQVVSGVLFAPRAPAAPSTGALAGANR